MPSSQRADASSRFRLGLVVPRFGDQIWGGAELHGRWLAERLARAGHEVDVFTTCAVDHRTWRNELPAGVERYKGVLTVRRFPISDRDLGIHGELDRAISSGFRLSPEEELLWLRHGPTSVPMEEELSARGESYDAILALPYLFGTTYFAFAACPSRAVIIPCLHDEPFAYFGFVREMLSGARGIMFNTNAESQLAQRIVGRLAPWGIVAVGLDAPAPGRRRRVRIPEPSILYVGRRESGKNTPMLIDYFVRYKRRHSAPLFLAFAGSGDPVPNRPDIVETKLNFRSPLDVFASATIACQPSVNESLSIVLLESWQAGRPALVHGSCDVTKEHCERSNGGLWFSSYAEFEAVLDRLLASQELRELLGRNGRAYVEREYSWDAVLGRFDESLRNILATDLTLDVGSGAL
ncbi:MAG TPA: glycosyltransferase family 4 protein [Actinomycetota bacterium]|jgi:glycosyltransferase involved in cell wall biosynthesis|nr:glycosyltransferase family 4 protein [Actinomycetota bacterium]